MITQGTLGTYREEIGQRVQHLRQQRHWTQTELAVRLGLSQGWLSQIENGNASLTAEQLFYVSGIFNESVDSFLPRKRGPADSRIQNALARLGAAHLHETDEVLPTDRLRDAADVIREVLVAPESPRHVTAIASVLVQHIPHLKIGHIRGRLIGTGLERRLGWVLDNTKAAIERELEDPGLLPRVVRVKYGRALSYLSLPWVGPPSSASPVEDIFDADIASEESLARVREERSDLSKKWGILSVIQPGDFRAALRQIHGTD
ncbi:helix-turn-helix domain-containing protein [Elusimicrobiota bacterium]